MYSTLASMTIGDSVHAELALEFASVAISSAEYWDEHIEEWRDQYCADDDPWGGGGGDLNAAATSDPDGSICDVGSEAIHQSNSVAAASDPGLWDYVEGAVVRDAIAMSGTAGLLLDGYRYASDNWLQFSRTTPGVRVHVRYNQPSTARLVVQGAKHVGRKLLLGNVYGAALSSAMVLQ
jgi:hypothetical protein